MRRLDRLGLAGRLLQLVVAALERGPGLRPEGFDDLERFVEASVAFGQSRERNPVGAELTLRPGRPEREIKPAHGHLIELRRRFGQDSWIAIEDPVDEHTDPGAAREERHRPHRGQGLESRAIVFAVERQEVVERPYRAEPQFLHGPDGDRVVRPARSLPLQLHPEVNRVPPNLHASTSLRTFLSRTSRGAKPAPECRPAPPPNLSVWEKAASNERFFETGGDSGSYRQGGVYLTGLGKTLTAQET